jgi:hypothetical protein
MASYRATFRKHWLLLIVPIIAATVVGGWLTFGAAPTYRSTASLWIDNSPSDGSSLNAGVAPSLVPNDGSNLTTPGTTSLTDPSEVEQQLLDELLYTSTFDFNVAKASSLGPFLATGRADRGFAPSDLLSKSSDEPLQEQLELSVGLGVASSTPGPQVLKVTYIGPSPAVAQSVLGSLITHMQGETSQYGQDFGKTAEAIYRSKLRAAQGVLANAKDSADQYQSDHPTATANSDPIYAALYRAVKSANTQLALAASGAESAAGATASGGQAPLIRLIDPPSLPAGPVAGTGHNVTGLFAGLFAGILASILGLFWLTPGDPRPWDAELSTASWLNPSPAPRARTVRRSSSEAQRPAPRTARRVAPAPPRADRTMRLADPNRAPETA